MGNREAMTSLFASRWTAAKIEAALVLNPRSPFFHHRHEIVIPNASHGLGLGWEADIIAVSKAGYLTEIEIKVSRADFRADSQKNKHRNDIKVRGRGFIKRFYYAMPLAIWQRCQDVWRVPGSGIIVVKDSCTRFGWHEVEIAIAAESRPGAKKIEGGQFRRAARLMSARYWTRVIGGDQ